MSGISTRIEKGQKRFTPKLKARPNRRAATASEDGTPAPTPPLSGSDSGTFGASLTEPESSSVTTTTTTDKESGSYRRPSTQAPMSPPLSYTRTIAAPKSPPFTPTKPKDKPSQGTLISFPSDRNSSSSLTSTGESSNSASKSAKGGSLITVPSTRTHADREEHSEAEGSESAKKRPKNGKQPARSRADRHWDEGEVLEDGEEVLPDYSDTPMYEFVKDMGVGRRSAVFLERQRQQDEKRKKLKLEQKEKSFRDQDREQSGIPQPDEEEYELEEDESEDGRPSTQIKADEKQETKTPQMAHARTFAPQVRVIDGRIELDMDSLTVDHAAVDAIEDSEPLEYVDESSTTKFTNSASYSKKQKSEKWSDEDTELFFKALSQWGTDFGIICTLFPNRSRISVRNKFKREDRTDHKRVEQALANKAPIDMEQLETISKKTFPEVSELDMIKKLPEEEDQEMLEAPEDDGMFDEGPFEEENVEEEEIVGSIEHDGPE